MVPFLFSSTINSIFLCFPFSFLFWFIGVFVATEERFVLELGMTGGWNFFFFLAYDVGVLPQFVHSFVLESVSARGQNEARSAEVDLSFINKKFLELLLSGF